MVQTINIVFSWPTSCRIIVVVEAFKFWFSLLNVHNTITLSKAFCTMHEKNKEICVQNKLVIVWTMIYDNTQGKKKIADTRATLQDAKNKFLKCTNKEHTKKNLHNNHFMTNYQLMSLVSVRP